MAKGQFSPRMMKRDAPEQDGVHGTMKETRCNDHNTNPPNSNEQPNYPKRGEWSNYQNVTEYFDSEGDALSIDDIVEKLQDKQKDLKLHEDIHLEADNTANMSQRAKRENKDECGEFNELYSALHSTFERTLDKRTALTTESYRCMATCEESLVV